MGQGFREGLLHLIAEVSSRRGALAVGGVSARQSVRSLWRCRLPPAHASFGDIASVPIVEFSRELRNDVLAGDITLSVRLWKQPRVKQGGCYRVGPGEIEVDAIELVPFAAVTAEDVRRAGEPDRETLRQRAAHA
jgi:hypothetical protein